LRAPPGAITRVVIEFGANAPDMPRTKRHMRIPALIAAAALILGACSSSNRVGQVFDTRQNAGPCPSAGSIYGVDRVVKFADENSGRYSDIAYTGEIVGVKLFCRYADDNPIIAEIDIDFAFGKGPQATADEHDYTYFVAVTRRNRRILHKERFSVRADFNGEVVTGTRQLIDSIEIPRVDETISGANFEILVGFELTEDQLEFNRAGKRYRLDAGAP